jgi:PDZ domain-containing secreted protein
MYLTQIYDIVYPNIRYLLITNQIFLDSFMTGLIEIGDTIIKINDMKVNKEGDLFQALETFKPGDTVKVTINRPDLEAPNSKALRLTQKVISIQLKASGSMGNPQYIIIPPSE